jgi:hypothetical protein
MVVFAKKMTVAQWLCLQKNDAYPFMGEFHNFANEEDEKINRPEGIFLPLFVAYVISAGLSGCFRWVFPGYQGEHPARPGE